MSRRVNKFSISAEEINDIARALQKLKWTFAETSSYFHKWVEQREKSIETIGDLQKKIVKIHQVCNVAQAVGSGMEIVGGVAMVAGVLFTAFGHKSVGKFLTETAAPATTVTGVATTMSSSLAEVGLTHRVMNQMKFVLAKDDAYTSLLVRNLKLSRDIDAQLKRVFNCSIFSNIFEDVVQLCVEAFSLMEAGYVEFSRLENELQRKAQKCSSISEYAETVFQNVCTTMKRISHDPKLCEAVQKICYILQKSPSLVDFVKFGIRISFQIDDILQSFSSLFTVGALKIGCGALATKCLLGTAQVAFGVIAMIDAVQEAQKHSTKYSEMLEEVKVALSIELKSVRNNYSKIFLKY